MWGALGRKQSRAPRSRTWEQQFHDKAPNYEMGNSDQQLEWVTGMPNRAGANGLMKPLKGLSEAAQLQLGGRQPSGGSTVKVVLKPVRQP